ncbi:pyridoxal phosphate-dependent aminotransferase [Burkholderia sp. Ax-1719]|nr:MalY/PatB family protein [Burkholderia sp. Ax-1719]NIE68663.1 pyridoxal phosphate-dependent aminotransferase [Burkholderia sp. Ax-1719]
METIVKLQFEEQGAGAASGGYRSIFDQVIDRRNSNSLKWAFGEKLLSAEEYAADPLPMWVADMDFRTPQPVIDALHEAVEFGVFGYSRGATERYVSAVIEWQAKRFGWDVSSEWVLQSSGIITALKNAIQAFSAPGDSVLIQTPVYAHFHDDVVLNGRRVVCAPLERKGAVYRFDEKIFEAAIKPDTRLFILSNPHNPTGNVWSEAELRAMGEICLRHGVIVISDEIHQDLILNPLKKHIPFASLSSQFADMSITCTAPSKTFNLPGLQSANLFVPNARLREELRRQFDRNMYQSVNSLGMVAAEAAYSHGEFWLEALLPYLRENQNVFRQAVNGLTSKIEVLPTDALYLAWMDCRGLGLDPDELNTFMLTQARLWLDKGQKFGMDGHGYMRANLGCPRSTIDEAVRRLAGALAVI